jgi:hypothetical protein
MVRAALAFALALCANAAVVDPLAAYGLEASAEVARVSLARGKLTKIVLKKGNGRRPSHGAKVSAHYDGKLAEEAKPFDSSRTRCGARARVRTRRVARALRSTPLPHPAASPSISTSARAVSSRAGMSASLRWRSASRRSS